MSSNFKIVQLTFLKYYENFFLQKSTPKSVANNFVHQNFHNEIFRCPMVREVLVDIIICSKIIFHGIFCNRRAAEICDVIHRSVYEFI